MKHFIAKIPANQNNVKCQRLRCFKKSPSNSKNNPLNNYGKAS